MLETFHYTCLRKKDKVKNEGVWEKTGKTMLETTRRKK